MCAGSNRLLRGRAGEPNPNPAGPVAGGGCNFEISYLLSREYPGLTLCEEVLTLEGVLRSACHPSCGGFPESAIATTVVCGPVGAAGALLCGAGGGSAEPRSAEIGSAERGYTGSDSGESGSAE